MAGTSNFTKSKKALKNKLIGNINDTLRFIKSEAEDRTPEDTKLLLKSYEIEPATQKGGKIIGKVVNNTEYAFFVEFGTRRAKNYHKPKGSVFFQSGDFKGLSGARMLTRAVDENRLEINKKLSKR